MRYFNTARWFCAYCPVHPAAEGFKDPASVRTHLDSTHGIPRAKADQGHDFYEGWQARRVYEEREAAAEKEAQRAATYLVQPNYTVEDFLVDAGDEPWPALEGGE